MKRYGLAKIFPSLINPNQLQYVGVKLQGSPLDSTPMAITADNLTIPLLAQDTNIYFETIAPSEHKLDKCPHIHLTLDTEWDPHSVCLAAMRTADAEMDVGVGVEPGLLNISSVLSAKRMAELLPPEQDIKAVDVELRTTFRSNERHSMKFAARLRNQSVVGVWLVQRGGLGGN